LALGLAAAGCAPVLNETRTEAVLESGFYAGEPYEIVTRTIEGANGPFDQTRVVYYGRTRPCILDSPKDCEFAARELIGEVKDSFFF
jgi:hypothetical protein